MLGFLKIFLATLVSPPGDVLHHVGLTVAEVVLGDVLHRLDDHGLVVASTNLEI